MIFFVEAALLLDQEIAAESTRQKSNDISDERAIMLSPRLFLLLRVATILLLIHSLASAVGNQHFRSVILVGSDTKLQFEQQADGLRVRLPDHAPGKYAYALRIMFDS